MSRVVFRAFDSLDVGGGGIQSSTDCKVVVDCSWSSSPQGAVALSE